MRLPVRVFGTFLLLACVASLFSQEVKIPTEYHVDCRRANVATHQEDVPHALHSLAEVNDLHLQQKDTILFRRGTACSGILAPKGDGFAIGAYGAGALPQIQAGPHDEAALSLSDQELISVSSLELIGGTTYGIHISGQKRTMHDITLTNLTVRNVHGTLQKKASGLVVISPSSSAATFHGVRLDGVRAYGTTQWSGIFIAGGSKENPATDVHVLNSVVHDVQGDGIVIFSARDSSIEHSLAWHTGMQHQQSIGTPNGIWTWQCTKCIVSDNEAFLTDSPGVDGGAFDIDWGNSENTIARNYGHDTQGYCISVFGANGPTTASVVDGNICVNNGLSPRLAQRQGALLLMTWSGGAIHGLTVSNNFIDWHPAGNTPAVQSGAKLDADQVVFRNNLIVTDARPEIDATIPFSKQDAKQVGSHWMHGAVIGDRSAARQTLRGSSFGRWRLVAHESHADAGADGYNSIFVDLLSAAVQYGSDRLRVELRGSPEMLAAACDWDLENVGVKLVEIHDPTGTWMQLSNASGRKIRNWHGAAPVADFGYTMRRLLGTPNYGALAFEAVRATD